MLLGCLKYILHKIYFITDNTFIGFYSWCFNNASGISTYDFVVFYISVRQVDSHLSCVFFFSFYGFLAAVVKPNGITF